MILLVLEPSRPTAGSSLLGLGGNDSDEARILQLIGGQLYISIYPSTKLCIQTQMQVGRCDTNHAEIAHEKKAIMIIMPVKLSGDEMTLIGPMKDQPTADEILSVQISCC